MAIRLNFSISQLLAALLMSLVVVIFEGCSSGDNSSRSTIKSDINTQSFDLPIEIDNTNETSAITRLLSNEQVIHDAGGGLALILIKDGKLVYRRGFGSFENDIDKVVPIASASKWISAGVVARLMDAGKYGLNDMVTGFYPYFDGVNPTPSPAPDDFVHDDRKERMTIAQMFSHTSGLSYQPAIHRRYDLPSIQEAVLEIYFNVPTDFEPGMFVQYAGVGMQIVGGISEMVMQQSWMDIFNEQLANPLGMTHTDYYGYPSGEIITDNPDIAGSIRTNIDDYMRFLFMIYSNGDYNGERVLSTEAVRSITQSYSESLTVLRSPFEPYYLDAPETMLFKTGLGSWLNVDDNNNPTYISSLGAWGCMPFIDYERNLIGIYMAFNTSAEYDPATQLNKNPATEVFMRDLKPILDQIFTD